MTRAIPGAIWLPDCNAGHIEARTSRFAFELRTKPVGVQAFPGTDLPPAVLGNCHYCKSTIGYAPQFETEVPNGD